jgi:hypothetical protein
MVIRRRRLTTVLMALALALVALVPSTALADRAVSHSGSRGVHGLVDSQEFPAATCRYSSSVQLQKIVVRAPIVYARDTGPGVQTATVGWRFRVQYSSGLGFSTYRTSAIVKASATDQRPAGFIGRSMQLTNPPEIEYRVRVDMYWYDSHGNQIGKATHAPEWYGWSAKTHGSGVTNTDTCNPIF